MKVLIIKLHENQSSRSRADICRQTDGQDMTGVFREYAIAPKSEF